MAGRAIDLVILPFTHEMKAGPFQETPQLKEGIRRYGFWEKSYSGAEELVKMLDEAGVEKALVTAPAGDTWNVPYEYVRSLVNEYPGRLYWMAGIDPRDIIGGLRGLERAIREHGAVGAQSFPHWFGLAPDDRSYYPFYAKCVELDVPMQIHVGLSGYPSMRDVGRPSTLDSIAVDFPDLRLIGIHIGYPWEREMISVAWKHPNVYIGVDQRDPRDWPPELITFIKGAGRTKAIWGTNYPNLDFTTALAAVDALDLEPDTKELFLYKNAQHVYNLA